MTAWVLDASAVLAVLQAEPGGEAVIPLLDAALLSTVNMSEVLAKLQENGIAREQAIYAVEGLEIGEIVPFDSAMAKEAAALRLPTKSHGLSLGDRACLALGRLRGLPVLTADKAWKTLRLCEVQVIR